LSKSAACRSEELKNLGLVFTSDRRQNKELDTRIDKASTALHEFYRFVVTKQELSNIAKLSVPGFVGR